MIAIERARKLWDGPRSTWITLCIVLSCQLVCALVLAVISAMDDIKVGQTFGDHWAVYLVHMIISVFAMFLFANKSKTHGLAVSHLFFRVVPSLHTPHTHTAHRHLFLDALVHGNCGVVVHAHHTRETKALRTTQWIGIRM